MGASNPTEDDEQEDAGDLFIGRASLSTPFCPKGTKMKKKLKWVVWMEIKKGFFNVFLAKFLSFSLFGRFYDGIFIYVAVAAIWLPKVVHQNTEKEGKEEIVVYTKEGKKYAYI